MTLQQDDFLVIAHIKDQLADADEPSYPVAICPTCYALVTQNAWEKHKEWHRKASKPGLPTRYRGGSA